MFDSISYEGRPQYLLQVIELVLVIVLNYIKS